MNTLTAIIGVASLAVVAAHGQVLLSKGAHYEQNFDTLGAGADGSALTRSWTNNNTLPGWYASSMAKGDYQSYRISDGTQRENGLYSFGPATGNTNDRALGSIASASPGVIAFGVRFKNDTKTAMTNITVSCTGEQWRISTPNASDQVLAFSYRISSTPLTDAAPGSEDGWTRVSKLNFTRLHYRGGANAIDGNAPENQTRFSNVLLPGAVLKPGEELFLRWVDVDDEGQNDHGLAIDDLSVSFTPLKAAR